MRHLAIPGDPNWTEEGHRFAWHMKLRDKQSSATFHVTTEAGRTFAVEPRDHMTFKQAFLMAGHPSRIVQFAHHLSDLHDGAEVRADVEGGVPLLQRVLDDGLNRRLVTPDDHVQSAGIELHHRTLQGPGANTLQHEPVVREQRVDRPQHAIADHGGLAQVVEEPCRKESKEPNAEPAPSRLRGSRPPVVIRHPPQTIGGQSFDQRSSLSCACRYASRSGPLSLASTRSTHARRS
jgi:hypothetical protein